MNNVIKTLKGCRLQLYQLKFLGYLQAGPRALLASRTSGSVSDVRTPTVSLGSCGNEELKEHKWKHIEWRITDPFARPQPTLKVTKDAAIRVDQICELLSRLYWCWISLGGGGWGVRSQHPTIDVSLNMKKKKKKLSPGMIHQHIYDYFHELLVLRLSLSLRDKIILKCKWILFYYHEDAHPQRRVCDGGSQEFTPAGTFFAAVSSISLQSITCRSLGVHSWNLIKSSEKLMLFVAAQVTFWPVTHFFMDTTETLSWHRMKMTDITLMLLTCFISCDSNTFLLCALMALLQDTKWDLWGFFPLQKIVE